MYDVIVIGAGPAGITAGIYAKRSNLNVLILYYGKAEIERAEKIVNYYGFENGIEGKNLYSNGIIQARNLGIEVEEKEIVDIEMNSDFTFLLKSKEKNYEAKSVVIATGNKKMKTNISRNRKI